MILAPFVASQAGRVGVDAPVYLWPNLLGSAMLGTLAATGSQWGFLLLEGCWTLVTARSLIKSRRKRA